MQCLKVNGVVRKFQKHLPNYTLQQYNTIALCKHQEDLPPFQKQNLDPSARKHKMCQSSPLILFHLQTPPLIQRALLDKVPIEYICNLNLPNAGYSLCPKLVLFALPVESSKSFVGQLSDNLSPVPLVRAKIWGHQRCKNLVLAHQGSSFSLWGSRDHGGSGTPTSRGSRSTWYPIEGLARLQS